MDNYYLTKSLQIVSKMLVVNQRISAIAGAALFFLLMAVVL